MRNESLNDLKLLTLLGHFSFQQQNLQGLALLQVRGSRIGSEDEEVTVFLLAGLDTLVELIEVLQAVEEEADAERWIYGGVFASSKGFTEITVFVLRDVFIGALDVVRIKIYVLIFLHSYKV